MKKIRYIVAMSILFFASCDDPKDPDVNILHSVKTDKAQPEYIRKSVNFFDDFFQGKTVSNLDYIKSRSELRATRDETTLKSLLAILNLLEKRIPNELPTEKEVDIFNREVGERNDYEYRINSLYVMAYLKNILPIIGYFDKKSADSAVGDLLNRFESKYGTTLAGKYWLEKFRTEWSQALEARAGHDGKWKSGRKQMGLE